jgi:nucleotide-binding universal stress UspA family protein
MSVHTPPTIVVGVDGSAPSLAAVDWAVEEAKRRDLPLRLIHATERPDRDSRPAESLTPEEILERAEHRVHASSGVPTITVAVDGDAAGTLVRESSSAAMVVVGNRGLGGFAGLLAGSVSVQTAAHARCPVVVVRPHLSDSQVPGQARHGVGRVVVGVDNCEHCAAVLRFAFDEAEQRGVGLTAVRAWQTPIGGGPGDFVGAVYQRTDLADVERKVLAEPLAPHVDRHPHVPVRQILIQGSVGGVLTHESIGAELVVLGSRGHGGFTGLLLGSASHAAIHHAGCPVAIIH